MENKSTNPDPEGSLGSNKNGAQIKEVILQLDVGEHARLKTLCARAAISLGDFIRVALSEAIERLEDEGDLNASAEVSKEMAEGREKAIPCKDAEKHLDWYDTLRALPTWKIWLYKRLLQRGLILPVNFGGEFYDVWRIWNKNPMECVKSSVYYNYESWVEWSGERPVCDAEFWKRLKAMKLIKGEPRRRREGGRVQMVQFVPLEEARRIFKSSVGETGRIWRIN